MVRARVLACKARDGMGLTNNSEVTGPSISMETGQFEEEIELEELYCGGLIKSPAHCQ